MSPRQRAFAAYRRRFGKKPAHLAFAPGRVNLLGEHVDYNDGFVLPAAIDRATWVAFSPARAAHSTLLAADFSEETSFTSDSIQAKTDPEGRPFPEWARYPAGVAWALSEAGLETPILEAAFASDVPRGAGLSSSASVEMAFAVAWSALGGWSLPPMQLARLGQRAENQYVGVNCGIMDQFAALCGEADRFLLLDCRSLDWQALPVPQNVNLVIADTTVRRKLTSGEYNQRRADCEQAVRILAAELPGVRTLRDVPPEDFNRLFGLLSSRVEKRARHVVEEIARVRAAIPLLEAGDLRAFGQSMNRCHASLRDLYEVSTPELDAMVEVAQALPGCYGARLTGAGFGGCTVNLVERDAAQSFTAELAARYRFRTGLKPEIYICRASDGARMVE